jgi:hypothetical protein
MSDDKQAQIAELVEWLEEVGHHAEPLSNLAAHFKGQRTSCKQTGYNFGRIETDNVLEVHFWFPLTDLAKAAPIDNPKQLDEWLEMISTNGIEASRIDNKKLGACVLITRLHHIPNDRVQSWLSADVIGDANYAALYRLLNMQNWPAIKK